MQVEVLINPLSLDHLRGESIAAKVTSALRYAMNAGVSDAKKKAAVDTGFMRSAIHAQIAGHEGALMADAEYSSYIEYGTSRISPRPFMEPAKDSIVTTFKNHLEKEWVQKWRQDSSSWDQRAVVANGWKMK